MLCKLTGSCPMAKQKRMIWATGKPMMKAMTLERKMFKDCFHRLKRHFRGRFSFTYFFLTKLSHQTLIRPKFVLTFYTHPKFRHIHKKFFQISAFM